MIKIDARGLNCPQPVILTKNALEGITEGEVNTLVDNNIAKENLSRLAINNQWDYVVEVAKDGFEIIIKKQTTKNDNSTCDETIAIVITSDKLGKGNDILASVLMKGYTYTLSEVKPVPNVILLLNSGVKLVCEGSEVVDNLIKLKDMGVEIISCGTCLDFYKLTDKLQLGIIGNMYEIVEKMNSASKVINI